MLCALSLWSLVSGLWWLSSSTNSSTSCFVASSSSGAGGWWMGAAGLRPAYMRVQTANFTHSCKHDSVVLIRTTRQVHPPNGEGVCAMPIEIPRICANSCHFDAIDPLETILKRVCGKNHSGRLINTASQVHPQLFRSLRAIPVGCRRRGCLKLT